jgi:hypothetical protein
MSCRAISLNNEGLRWSLMLSNNHDVEVGRTSVRVISWIRAGRGNSQSSA